jgi:hypothetical protein
MTFLNPLYLLGLAAASIPIILHLLTLRRARVVEFSTLTFLKELQRSRIRKLKIRQWLLLALRVLIIIFAVLAFTRPALRSTFGFLPGTQARSSVVIVIDDSFSMFASDEGGTLIKQAREKATEILDMLEPGDEVAIIRMSEARSEAHRFTAALGAARDALAGIEPSFRHVQSADALTAASVLLSSSGNINRELYILTDEQRSHYSLEGVQQKLFDASVRTFIVPFGVKTPGNSSVADVRIESSFFEKNKPVEVAATVVNATPTALSGALVSIFLDGERVSQKTVDIAAGGRAEVRFQVTPTRSGFVRGAVELEDDAIPEDNQRHFSFHVPERLRLLVAAASPKDAQILRIALAPAPDAASVFDITAGDAATLAAANLATYDAVVVAGAAQLGDAATNRLADWVRGGGGLFVLPDAEGSLDGFTRLLRAVGLPAPAGVVGAPGRTSQFSSFASVDYDHPLFRGVFVENDAITGQARQSTQQPRIESPHLYANVRLRGGDESRTVITTSGADAFLVDQRNGTGRVLALAVPAELTWSDFPLRGVFVPLLHRSMYYLAAREDDVRTATVGDAVDLSLPPVAASSWELRAPDGEPERLAPRSLTSGLSIPLRNLDRPGVYELRAGERLVRTIAVNIDPTESDMTRIGDDERSAWYRHLGIDAPVRLDQRTSVQAAVTEARFGVELWKYLLALALLCAVAEMLVARDVRHRERDIDTA